VELKFSLDIWERVYVKFVAEIDRSHVLEKQTGRNWNNLFALSAQNKHIHIASDLLE